MERGKKVLYLVLRKALYGCLKSALLWYELYVSILKDLGFKLNQYDNCVANKIIRGKQCSIGFWVDDNFASHAEQEVLDDIVEKLERRVGKMTVSRGDTHVFLGMKITMNNNATLSICMQEYVQEALDAFPDNLKNKASSPARANLFTVNEDSPQLNQERGEIFHSLVMKLMYVCQRARPDIVTAIAFLCTRVSKSTEEDWNKLKRLLEFLKERSMTSSFWEQTK